MEILYGINQIRVLSELDDGSADGSATAINSVAIQQMGWAPVYIDGAVATQRGGDNILAQIEEDDNFLGYQFTLDMAALEPALKAAIAGGTVVANKYYTPKDSTEMPYPFRFKFWIKNFTQSDSASTQDGFIEFEAPFCKKGRFGSSTANQQVFSNDQFTFIARKNSSNPSNIESPLTHDEVAAIV